MPWNVSREESIEQLQQSLPRWNGEVERLLSVLNRVNLEGNVPIHQVEMFEMFWGLAEVGPLSYSDVGRHYGVSRTTATRRCEELLELLRQPEWWE